MCRINTHMKDFSFYSSECVVLKWPSPFSIVSFSLCLGSFITPDAENRARHYRAYILSIGLPLNALMLMCYSLHFPLLSVLSTWPILVVFVFEHQGKMRHYQGKQEPVKSPLSSGERFVFTGFPNINVPATHLQLNLMSVHSYIFTVSSISYIMLPPKYVICTHAITNTWSWTDLNAEKRRILY